MNPLRRWCGVLTARPKRLVRKRRDLDLSEFDFHTVGEVLRRDPEQRAAMQARVAKREEARRRAFGEANRDEPSLEEQLADQDRLTRDARECARELFTRLPEPEQNRIVGDQTWQWPWLLRSNLTWHPASLPSVQRRQRNTPPEGEPERGEESEPEPILLPMVCDCGERGQAAARKLMAEVTARLAQGSSTFKARQVTDRDFLDAVIASLHWDLRVTITGIHMDMWYLVRAEWLTDDNWDVDVSVQCDRPEYGLAAIWKHFADRASLVPLD